MEGSDVMLGPLHLSPGSVINSLSQVVSLSFCLITVKIGLEAWL